MSDDNTASKNYYRRIAQELAEFDTPQARYQAVLDRHWEVQRELRLGRRLQRSLFLRWRNPRYGRLWCRYGRCRLLPDL
jgi:hypothetical protein